MRRLAFSPPSALASLGCVVLVLAVFAPVALAQGEQVRELRGPRPFALTCRIAGPAQWPQGAELHVFFNRLSGGTYYDLRLTRGAAELAKLVNGRRALLAGPAKISPAGSHTLAVRRTWWKIVVVCDGTIILRAFDGELMGGAVGWSATSPALSVSDLSVTHFGEIYMADSFERTEGEKGAWEVAEGQFGNVGLHSMKPTPRLAANPFSFGAPGFDRSLAIIGGWHWDGYRASVSAKGGGAVALGLAFYVQDKDNFLLFRWVRGPDNDPTGRQRQLIRVRNGRWTLLESKPGGFADDRWYRLRVYACDGDIAALIDDELVFRRRVDDFGMGRVALYSAGGGPAYFDDLSVVSFERFSEEFDNPVGGGWQAITGRWRRAGGKLFGRAERFHALALCGEPQWRDVRCRALVALAPGTSAGLVARYANGSYYALQADAPLAGPRGTVAVKLLRVSAGQSVPLAQGQAPAAGQQVELKLIAEGPYLAGLVGGKKIVECADGLLEGGRVGLTVPSAREVAFERFSAEIVPRPDPGPNITEQFTKEDTMAGWASPSGRWRSAKKDERTVRWFKGTFYSDVAISAALPPQTKAGRLSLAVCADGQAMNSGYTLELSAENPAQAVAVLRRAGEMVATGNVAGLNDGEHMVSLERRGSMIWAAIDGKPVARFRDPQPLAGRNVAFAAQGWPVSAKQVSVRGANVLEYTFSRAPVDWYPRRGVWEVTDRWACEPGWAWFAGYNDQCPLLWSKRVFRGDITVECYLAPKMLQGKPSYPEPGDLNCTICADGSRLDSGYSFIFSGFGNKQTAILKGSQVVASVPENRLRSKDHFHRHWFYVRIEKRGSELIYSIDGEPVLRWQDPEPLSGGRVAFWSYGRNGLLNARTRISYEAGGELVPLPPPPEEPQSDIPFSIYK